MKAKKLIGLLMAIIMCLGAVMPLSAFAEGEQAQSSNESRIIWEEDFTNAQKTGTVNMSGNPNVIAENNGFFACTTKDSNTGDPLTTYDFSNGTLKYTKKNSGDYFDIRFLPGSQMGKDLKQDFILSMMIKPNTASMDAQFSWSGEGGSASENINSTGLHIDNGSFYIGRTKAPTDVKIPKDKWSTIEIAFHWNPDATPDDAAFGKGAIDSYSVLLNGFKLYTAQSTHMIQNINTFRMFQWTGTGLFEFDNMRVALGNESLHGYTSADAPQIVYKEDFSTLDEPDRTGATDPIGSKNGLWTTCLHTTIGGGSMNLDAVACAEEKCPVLGNRLFDLRFQSKAYAMQRDLQQDFVLAFRIKPTTDNLKMSYFSWKDDAGVTQAELFKFDDGAMVLGKNDAGDPQVTNGKLPANEWSFVELVFNYDETNNKWGTLSANLNGVPVKRLSDGATEVALTAAVTNPSFFRMLGHASHSYSLDDLTIALGNDSIYWNYIKNDGETQVFFDEDYSSFDAYAGVVENAHLFAAAYKNEDLVVNGALNLKKNEKADPHIDLQLYNLSDVTRQVVKGDATFSMRFKTTEGFASTNEFLAFREKDGSWIDAIKYNNNAIALYNGATKIGSKAISTTEYNTVEIMFNYDYVAKTYASINVYVNGEDIGNLVLTNSLSGVSQFRAMRTWGDASVGETAFIDSIKIFEGHESLHEAKTEFVGYQASVAADNKFNLRLVGVMTEEDYSNYEKVGFIVKATYGDVVMEKTHETNSVYEKIVATEGCDYTEYTAEQLGGKYIFALNCMNVPADKGVITFEVTTYYQLEDMDTFEEVTVKFTVDPTKDIPQADVK